jgi:glycosyltransferase involved in cell wall biosynthesis
LFDRVTELRIVHVTATFPPYHGGTGNVAFHNALELVRRGHDVHVYTPRIVGAENEESRFGVEIHRLRSIFHFGNAVVLPQLLNYLRSFDLIHLHHPFYGGELTVLASCRWHIPMVITYHQDVLLNRPIALAEKIMRYTIGQMVLCRAACVLFTSQDYFQHSHAHPLLKKSKTRIDTLPNGVDTNHFSPGSPTVDLFSKLKLHPRTRVILMVAGLDRAHYFKGVGVFLQALSRIPTNVIGLIVGDGELHSEYAAQSRALKLGARVHFAGHVPDDALPDYYRLADVTVLPSETRGEAFGLVLLESLACATPVVASNLPGVRTVVDHGRDGYLVQPGNPQDLADKITCLLQLTPAQLQEFGYYGREKVEEKYRWSVIGTQLEAIYQEILVE